MKKKFLESIYAISGSLIIVFALVVWSRFMYGHGYITGERAAMDSVIKIAERQLENPKIVTRFKVQTPKDTVTYILSTRTIGNCLKEDWKSFYDSISK